MQALIFDVDGTLAETEEAHRLAFNEAFHAAGLGWEWDQRMYRDLLLVTGGRERIRHYVETYDPGALSEDGMAERIAALHLHKTEIYNRRLAAGEVSLRPGIRRLMEEARAAGLRLAIATTTSRVNVSGLLDSTIGAHACDWFEVIGAGEDGAKKKPAPDVYLFVLERLGLPGSACLAVEDSLNGLKAARAAGIPTLAVRSLYTDDHDMSEAAAIYDHLGDVTLDDLRRVHAAARGER